MKSKNLMIIIASIFVLLIMFFIFPTMYRYDKINQKFPVRINRITGSTQILYMDGWQLVDAVQPVISESSNVQLENLRKELLEKISENNSIIQQEVINQIKEEIITQVQSDLDVIRKDINQYKKFETDPDNYFTIGSTKDEVKKIMGVPTSTQEIFGGGDWWMYGNSQITFKNNKVTEYHNSDNNLRIR